MYAPTLMAKFCQKCLSVSDKCVAVNCVGSAMSEAVLNMEEAERDRPKPKEPPRLLIGMTDVRVKIGTDIQFYAKGGFN